MRFDNKNIFFHTEKRSSLLLSNFYTAYEDWTVNSFSVLRLAWYFHHSRRDKHTYNIKYIGMYWEQGGATFLSERCYVTLAGFRTWGVTACRARSRRRRWGTSFPWRARWRGGGRGGGRGRRPLLQPRFRRGERGALLKKVYNISTNERISGIASASGTECQWFESNRGVRCNTLAGFYLTTHSTCLLGRRRRRYH
jgi:hypothetical protein